MKQSEAKDFWPLFKAWFDGKNMQCRGELYGFSKDWIDITDDDKSDSPIFIDDSIFIEMIKRPNYFRIKPEPREWYLCIDSSGEVCGARLAGNQFFNVKVREVTE